MAQNEFPQKLLVAVGDHAAHPDDNCGTTGEQGSAVADALLPLVLACRELVITHGNGSTLGGSLTRQAHARDVVAPARLDVCIADSQGGSGYVLMQAIGNALAGVGSPRPVTCLLTEVEVDAADAAFTVPGTPIGPYFAAHRARALIADGWQMLEDAEHGWRVAVPSPAPRKIVNLAAIERALRVQDVVIAAGGGGIPVLRGPGGRRHGVQAVIDENLTSALLARALGIDQMLILAAVPKLAIRYRQPGERWLDTVRAGRLQRHLAQGYFGRGGMARKVDAALRFLAAGGRRAIIAHLDEAMAAVRGDAGTQILPD